MFCFLDTFSVECFNTSIFDYMFAFFPAKSTLRGSGVVARQRPQIDLKSPSGDADYFPGGPLSKLI